MTRATPAQRARAVGVLWLVLVALVGFALGVGWAGVAGWVAR